MEIREIFAQNLRSAREAQGISQEDLAHRAGIDRTYVSALERRLYSASIDVVDQLAKALGVEPADLLSTARPSTTTSSRSDERTS